MTGKNSTLSAALDPIASATIAIAGISIIGMAIVEGWQVFARYVLNSAPSWTEPVALFFMATTMMFGAAAGVRSSRHFGFFILIESAKPPLRRALRVFANLIAAGTGLMLALWGGEMMIDAWDYRMAGAPLPQGFSFMPLCFGGTLITLFAIERIIVPLPEQLPPRE
ncbi:TRAP transporter small permease [Povalibacter sp.]|uniref:TRAP transporter small permease n=1 Tax=Povalibacter sp. TaxID=1962978 RepID=UPI002F40BDC7